MSKGRLKSKTNPKGICFSCGDNLKNRDRNTMYCKGCYKLIRLLHHNIQQIISRFKKRYEKYNITVKKNVVIMIQKKGRLSHNSRFNKLKIPKT